MTQRLAPSLAAAVLTTALATLPACGTGPTPSTSAGPFPTARTPDTPRAPTPSILAWEEQGKEMRVLEASALLVYRFGCGRCTRFESRVMFLQADGCFQLFDVPNRAALLHGRATPDVIDAVQAFLTDDFPALEEGPPLSDWTSPWISLASKGREVRRVEGFDHVLPEPMARIDRALGTMLRTDDGGDITACRPRTP